MKKNFDTIMRQQLQESFENLNQLAKNPRPKNGWIQTIRQLFGISSSQLAKKMGCTRPNIAAFERREKKGTITIQTLEHIAQAMNCKFVYFFIPNKPLEQIFENQARLVAKKRLKSIGHSMELELQGLSVSQKKQQENDLVQELLQGDPKHLWENEDEI